MICHETTVVLCRKSDREIRTVHASEPAYAIRERYIKAALGDRQLDMGKWSIDLDENLVLSIEPTLVSVTENLRYPWGPSKVVRHVGRKRPSSAGH